MSPYGAVYALGMVVAIAATILLARSVGCPARTTLTFLTYLAASTFAGAQAAGTVTSMVNGDGVVLPQLHGGTGASWGGIVAAAVCVGVARRHMAADVFDRVLAATVALVPWMQAAGRIGCYAAGCCHGRPCALPWAVQHPTAAGVSVHPVQLYETAACLALSAALLVRFRTTGGRVPWTSSLAAYLSGYAAIRLITEAFRGDADRGLVLGVSIASALAAGWLVAIAAWTGVRAVRDRHDDAPRRIP